MKAIFQKILLTAALLVATNVQAESGEGRNGPDREGISIPQTVDRLMTVQELLEQFRVCRTDALKVQLGNILQMEIFESASNIPKAFSGRILSFIPLRAEDGRYAVLYFEERYRDNIGGSGFYLTMTPVEGKYVYRNGALGLAIRSGAQDPLKDARVKNEIFDWLISTPATGKKSFNLISKLAIELTVTDKTSGELKTVILGPKDHNNGRVVSLADDAKTGWNKNLDNYVRSFRAYNTNIDKSYSTMSKDYKGQDRSLLVIYFDGDLERLQNCLSETIK